MTRTATARVREAYRRIAAVHRPEVWITLRDEREVLAEAEDVDGRDLPLAGLVFAVNDNIDVAGLPTTAACPAYAYAPEASATAVRRLTGAGALVLGKTNLDQFATGLTGTRSPYGAVRHARLPERISGGSSSGSAVAVALGIADFALGTDTAGGGRVPAALHGIVSLKPTLGLVPTTGMVPAARPYGCVSVLAPSLDLGQRALAVTTGPDPADPASRTWPPSVRLSAGDTPKIAIPDDSALLPLTTEAKYAFHAAAGRLRGFGAKVESVDITPFLEAARLLHDGTLAAGRFAAVGDFVIGHLDRTDPAVAETVLSGGELAAHRLAADIARLDRRKVEALAVLRGFDALLLPTTADHPSVGEAQADPAGVSTRLSTYAGFVNPLDLAAVAVPAGTADGSPFGVSVIARAFDDQVAIDVAALLTGEQAATPYPGTGVGLVVSGAGARREVARLGGRFAGESRTGDRWTVSASRLGHLAATLPDGEWKVSP